MVNYCVNYCSCINLEIEAFNYMINIFSLSIRGVVMLPIYAKATGIDRKAQREFIAMRRDEITRLVLRDIMI